MFLIQRADFGNANSRGEGDISELKKFFEDTFIEEVQGDKKNFHCFSNAWGFYHFHNACIKNGNDGIIVGFDENKLEWERLQKENAKFVSMDKWNSMVLKPTLAIQIPVR